MGPTDGAGRTHHAEATRGIEPLYKALQASASPLGHVAWSDGD